MARYHVNPNTGNPGQCKAKVSCPYGNLETDHFDSKEEARAAYESGQLDQAFATLRKALDEVVPSADIMDHDLLKHADKTYWPEINEVSADRLLSSDHMAHEVGDLYVSTRIAPTILANGKEGSVVETMILDSNNDELRSTYTDSSDLTSRQNQHAEAIEYAARVQAEELEIRMSEEEAMAIDEYYQEHPPIFINHVDGFYEVHANGQRIYSTADQALAAVAEEVSKTGMWREIATMPNPMAFSYVKELAEKGEEAIKEDREKHLKNYDAERLLINEAASKVLDHRKYLTSLNEYYPEAEPPF